MASRRWWRNWTLVLICGVLPGASALAAGAAVPALPSADDFEKADAKDLPGLREDIVTAAGLMTNTDKFTFVSGKLLPDFDRADHGINSKNDAVRLNTAILFDKLSTIATQNVQIKMLSSSDAAIRYWGAKGLGDISASLISAHATAAPVLALQNAGAKPETSAIVMQEIIRSLGKDKFEDMPAMVKVLEAMAGQMKAIQPEASALQSAAQALEFVASKAAIAVAADKLQAATIAALSASLAAQWERHVLKALQANDPTVTSVPKDYADAVQHVVEAATKALSAAASKNYPVPQGASPDELLLKVNALVGTPGDRAGTVQGDIKGVAVPPVITPGP